MKKPKNENLTKNITGAATNVSRKASVPAFAKIDNINLPKTKSASAGGSGGLSPLIGGSHSAGGAIGNISNGLSNDRNLRPNSNVRDVQFAPGIRSIKVGQYTIEARGDDPQCSPIEGSDRFGRCSVGAISPLLGAPGEVLILGPDREVLRSRTPRDDGKRAYCQIVISTNVPFDDVLECGYEEPELTPRQPI